MKVDKGSLETTPTPISNDSMTYWGTRAPLQARHSQGQSQWEMPLNTSPWVGKIYLSLHGRLR